jgi:dihydroorotate dehydrogenase electron transfer subunit
LAFLILCSVVNCYGDLQNGGTATVPLPQTAPIVQIVEETRTIRSFVLDAELPDAVPGQFIMLWLPGVDEKPMSIAAPAPLTVTAARVGEFTTLLHQQKVGNRLGWRGPYGHGFELDDKSPALIVSGGCGVGPMHFLATRAIDQGIETTLALGARTDTALPYLHRFQELEVDVLVATDDGSMGYEGYVTDLVKDTISRWSGRQPVIYACGPEPMLVALHRLCRELDLSGQLSLERYMKCGFGICGQCALDGLLVCKDGPVFEVEQLDGVSDFGHARRSATGRRLPLR